MQVDLICSFEGPVNVFILLNNLIGGLINDILCYQCLTAFSPFLFQKELSSITPTLSIAYSERSTKHMSSITNRNIVVLATARSSVSIEMKKNDYLISYTVSIPISLACPSIPTILYNRLIPTNDASAPYPSTPLILPPHHILLPRQRMQLQIGTCHGLTIEEKRTV